VSHDGASWIAKYEMEDDVTLVGRGDSISAALNDFDMQWMGLK
jgi:hypothetical protein